MNRNCKNKSSICMVLIAGCLWGCMGLLVRPLQTIGLQTMEIVALRSIVTFVVMTLIIIIKEPAAFHIKIKDSWIFFGTGICSIVFFNYCYFMTIGRTSLSVAAVLLYTAPAFVILMSAIFFHERITLLKIAAVALTFFGCMLVAGVNTSQTALTLQGLVSGLLAGFFYALYSIFAKIASNRGYSGKTITFYTFLMATAGTLPFIKPMHVAGCFMTDDKMILYAFLLIIVTTIFPYLFYTKGLAGIEPGQAAVAASIEPVMATIVGIVIYHEKLSLTGLIGMILVLFSIILINMKKNCYYSQSNK